MSTDASQRPPRARQAGRRLGVFERYLTLWVVLCIGVGIGVGRLFPQVAVTLDAISLYQVSIPIAICLFFRMYPIMVKIDFSQAKQAAQTPKPVVLTLVVNWLIKPFTMVVFAQFCLGWLFRPLLTGTELIRGGQIALADSYIAGTILLGIAQKLGLYYEDAAPAALIGASNHFEVAIATAVTLFGLNSGAALATGVGVLIEVPLMLLLVELCKRTAFWFPRAPDKATLPDPRCLPGQF